MTPAAIRRRVKAWQKKLLLGDWKIAVEVGPLADSGEKADCDAKPGDKRKGWVYRNATLRFDPEKVPGDDWDGYIVHELLHCYTWPLEQAAENWAGENEALYESVRDTAEIVVTNLEKAFLSSSGAKL
jgi:hypothetical protein